LTEAICRLNRMALERRYIEEVGEAVEALGIMLERELGRITQGLAELYRMVTLTQDQEKTISQKMDDLKDDMLRTQKHLGEFETMISRVESRLLDLQKDLSDEEDDAADIKNDLLVIKKDLQFARSDIKELLKRQDDLEKGLMHPQERDEGN
jgi:septation ring formation regulator EzrA